MNDQRTINANQIVTSKIISLIESCNRVRVNLHEEITWSGLLDDFSALGTSLRLLRQVIPSNYNALSPIPTNLPAEMSNITTIPDFLAAIPSDNTFNEVLQILQARGVIGKHTTTQDTKQLRYVPLLSDASKLKTDIQPNYPKPAQLRKNYEMLDGITARLYRGTSLYVPAKKYEL